MLVNLATTLEYAQKNGCCIPAINIYNLETIEGVLKAAYESDFPIIISFGEAYLNHANFKQIVSIIQNSSYNKYNLITIHLDHAKKIKNIYEAINNGFTSVMYDGSSLEYELNVKFTKSIVEYAKQNNVSVEAELGYMNSEDGHGEILENGYTSADMAREFVESTDIDALAIAIGNAHDVYKGEPELDFERLDPINKYTNIPLVLHGTSGIPEFQIERAISLGIRKINVNTEVALGASKKAYDVLKSGNLVRLDQLMLEVEKQVTDITNRFIKICSK